MVKSDDDPYRIAVGLSSIITELPDGRAEVHFSAAAIMPSAGIVPSIDRDQIVDQHLLPACVGLMRAWSDQPGGCIMGRLNILSLSAITALGFALLPGGAVAQQKTLKEQLTGTWSLVSVETVKKDGTKVPFVEGSDIKGVQIFTNKHFSFQVIANFPKLASNNRLDTTPEENKAVAHGVQSYYGTYTVNEAEKSWTTHTERASQPNQNGTDTKRTITSITATELRYSTPLASGNTNNFVWKREE